MMIPISAQLGYKCRADAADSIHLFGIGCSIKSKMSLLNYFKTTSSSSRRKYPPPPAGLPDPNTAATEMEAEACAAANAAIVKDGRTSQKKRGSYNDFSEEDRLKIAKKAQEIGPAKASQHFSAIYGRPVNKLSVRWIRDKYRNKLKTRLVTGDATPMNKLEKEKRGMPTMLPTEIDGAVKNHLQRIRDGGGIVNRRIFMATGKGVLHKYGGTACAREEDLSKTWARSVLNRMDYVQRKGTKAARKVPDNLPDIHSEFHERIKSFVQENSIHTKA
jgi:hypothetical protein